MTGLSDRQVILLQLHGMLELVRQKVSMARVAFEGDKETAEYLRKVDLGLVRLENFSLENGYRPKPVDGEG